jgi:NAD(P)-dependent dehydrogenase (short-subunit alcohol dehydrogenase family)
MKTWFITGTSSGFGRILCEKLQIDTNLVGSISLIRACLPHLRRQGGGRILQVSSEGGQMTYPGFSLYHATKWGIEGFVEAVAREVEPFGIRFTLVEPGPTGTNFGAGLVKADPLPAYDETPVGELRRAWTAGRFRVTGDASKVVDAMIGADAALSEPLQLNPCIHPSANQATRPQSACANLCLPSEKR